MKTIWTMAVCVGLSATAASAQGIVTLVEQPNAALYGGDGQTRDDLLDGLDKLGANAKERNEVNLDKNMMALTANRRGGRYADLSQKMDLISVRNYEFAERGKYSQADVDALRKKLESNGWSHIVRNESKEESNDIAVKPAGDGYLTDMVILNAEPKEVNIVHLKGHFKMEDVSSAMGATMGLSHGAGAGAMGTLGALGGYSHSSSSSSSTSTGTRMTNSTSPSAPPAPPAPPSR